MAGSVTGASLALAGCNPGWWLLGLYVPRNLGDPIDLTMINLWSIIYIYMDYKVKSNLLNLFQFILQVDSSSRAFYLQKLTFD